MPNLWEHDMTTTTYGDYLPNLWEHDSTQLLLLMGLIAIAELLIFLIEGHVFA